MNIIEKIISFVKNIFYKQEEVKKLEEPKQHINQKTREDFIKSLRVITNGKRKKTEIETLICGGDGLGIQKKISY